MIINMHINISIKLYPNGSVLVQFSLQKSAFRIKIKLLNEAGLDGMKMRMRMTKPNKQKGAEKIRLSKHILYTEWSCNTQGFIKTFFLKMSRKNLFGWFQFYPPLHSTHSPIVNGILRGIAGRGGGIATITPFGIASIREGKVSLRCWLPLLEYERGNKNGFTGSLSVWAIELKCPRIHLSLLPFSSFCISSPNSVSTFYL